MLLELADFLALAEDLLARMAEPKRLIWVDGADHFFAGALDALEETVWRETREYAML